MEEETQLGDLPEACLAYAISLTSPRDACRFAAVSLSFRTTADSDHVWQRFIPGELLDRRAAAVQQPSLAANARRRRKKDAYLALCDGGGVPVDGDAGRRVWLDKASGAKCYALSARRLSLPWDDGEYSWRWMPHPLSRFAEVAELVDCTCLDIYAHLPTAALTPATGGYGAYLVYGAAESGHRGLSNPDQETTVTVGGRVVDSRRVCLRLDQEGDDDGPRRRGDGWWEVEMGRVRTTSDDDAPGEEEEEEEVVASFEVFGWYPKRGLLVEGIEFRPVHT